MDIMPKCCARCVLCQSDKYGYYCVVYEESLNKLEQKPKWCPLKELPERMKYHNGTYNGQVKGWNLCLEKILSI